MIDAIMSIAIPTRERETMRGNYDRFLIANQAVVTADI
jgi:hypothetical protein